jgi:glutamate/tyrosine decarboxylase-like PLP-dependent enzyme
MHRKRIYSESSFNPKFKGSDFFDEFLIHEAESTDAWFLGPKGENADLLTELLKEAIKSIIDGRMEFHPEDASVLEPDFKKEKKYINAVELIRSNFGRLVKFLDDYDTPFYSFRYQGHMNWDLSLPSVAAYFATMLHNPNNVTVQASTATTFLELALGKDICGMIGMNSKSPLPWAHITTDGTIANIESVWSVRELKHFPFAVKEFITQSKDFEKIRTIEVTQPNDEAKKLLELTNWELFNITNDEALSLPKKISALSGTEEVNIWKEILLNHSLNSLGISKFYNKHRINFLPAVAVPSTKHYSWSKAASVLGFGHGLLTDGYDSGLLHIFVDEKARMDIDKLTELLDHCSNPENNKPLMMIVAVMGSTEESAIDPLKQILDIRELYRKTKNFDFNIHADAAYGGYCLSAIRKNYPIEWPFAANLSSNENPFVDYEKKIPLSKYSIEQLKQIRYCDSVTIDPHKWAYIPYSAGSLTYRNGEMINLVSFGAPYIGDESSLPSVGGFGLEGSKPGASASAVFFSHSVIRPSESGYGRIIKNCLINARLFYISLLCIQDKDDPFFVVPLAELPKLEGHDVQILEFIKENLHKRRHEHFIDNEDVYHLFKEIGPDQNMVDYAFNFYVDIEKRIPNTDMNLINKLNAAIYDKLHIKEGNPTGQIAMMLSMTTFEREEYGDKFMNRFAKRLCSANSETVNEINCLRSTIMNPWLAESDSDHLNFYERTIMPVLKKTVIECCESLIF